MSEVNVSLDLVDSVIANDYHDATGDIPESSSGSDSLNGETDALAAMKLDPAVLEAQVTLDGAEFQGSASESGAAASNGSGSFVSDETPTTALIETKGSSHSVRSRTASTASVFSQTGSTASVRTPTTPTSASVGSQASSSSGSVRSRTTSTGSVRSHTSSSDWESAYERVLSAQQAALDAISPEQLGLLLRYVATLRRQRHSLQKTLECAFCKNNGEAFAWYSSHALKDWRGRVLCPVLRAFRCPRCGATGDRAHTIKYCQDNQDTGIFTSV